VLVLGAATQLGAEASAAYALRGATVTLFDDDLTAADRLAEALREQGCSVSVDAGAAEPMSAPAAGSAAYDVVVGVDHVIGDRAPTPPRPIFVRIRRASDADVGAKADRWVHADITFDASDDGTPLLRHIVGAVAEATLRGDWAGSLRVHIAANGFSVDPA
jgi:hypothetical protein